MTDRMIVFMYVWHIGEAIYNKEFIKLALAVSFTTNYFTLINPFPPVLSWRPGPKSTQSRIVYKSPLFTLILQNNDSNQPGANYSGKSLCLK